MAAETIVVEIDESQLKAQKSNNYSLFLAKKVNGEFTVIWQSLGPYASAGQPSYEPKNTFSITIPSFQINYGNVTMQEGAVSFTSGGNPVEIDLNQQVTLDKNGIFSPATNGGAKGSLTVNNALAANPHEALYDNSGNPIYVNVDSGMDIGVATLTPIDEYQIWFDSFQQTGTIIAHNISNAGSVVFSGGDSVKTISYNKDGAWQNGGLSDIAEEAGLAPQAGELAVLVAATFTKALTIGAVTYLLNKLIGKFSGGLKPTEITTSVGSARLEVKFQASNRISRELFQQDAYEIAVSKALTSASTDPASDLGGESWTLSETRLSVTY